MTSSTRCGASPVIASMRPAMRSRPSPRLDTSFATSLPPFQRPCTLTRTPSSLSKLTSRHSVSEVTSTRKPSSSKRWSRPLTRTAVPMSSSSSAGSTTSTSETTNTVSRRSPLASTQCPTRNCASVGLSPEGLVSCAHRAPAVTHQITSKSKRFMSRVERLPPQRCGVGTARHAVYADAAYERGPCARH